MRPAPGSTVKKPYRAPKLSMYGDLTQMTLAIKKGLGQLDGINMMKRT